jgi:hypothetical protein
MRSLHRPRREHQLEGLVMPVAHRLRRLAPAALAVLVLAAPGAAFAAKARIVLPATDANVKAAPGARTTATVTTPVLDAMRETAPGVYEGIVPVRLPDGSWYVELDERFHMVSVAQRPVAGGPIGKGCVHGAAGVQAWRASLVAREAARPQVTTPAGVVPAKWEAK